VRDAVPVSGGLDIRFFGRESRKRGVDEDRLATSCHELVEPVLDVMLGNPDTVEIAFGNSPHIDDVVMQALDEALQVVALEHKHCGWTARGYIKCPVPDISEGSAADNYRTLVREWAVTTEVFMDTLCAHLQTRDLADRTPLHDGAPEGWADNRKRRDRLVTLLDKALAPHGFRVTDSGEVLLTEHAGTNVYIEGPSLDVLDKVGWSDVSANMRDAAREIDEGNYGDALTDIGSGLQAALRQAGFPGKTLGEQFRTARAKPSDDDAAHPGQPFAGVHTKLGQAADNLSEWLATIRNQISDAHDGEEATKAEADLALRTGLALSAWLVDLHAAE
jgi:hypothetical protein